MILTLHLTGGSRYCGARSFLLLLLVMGLVSTSFSQRLVSSYVPQKDEYIALDRFPEVVNYPYVRKKMGYPFAARLAGIEGTVYTRVLVDEDGNFVQHQIIRSPHPSLTRVVERHIEKLQFREASQGKVGVAAWISIPFIFYEELGTYMKVRQDHPVDYGYKPYRPENLFGVGVEQMQKQQYDLAYRHYSVALNKMLQQRRKSKETVKWMVRMYCARSEVQLMQQHWKGAEKDCAEAFELIKQSNAQLPASVIFRLHTNRGIALVLQNNFNRSSKDFSNAESFFTQDDSLFSHPFLGGELPMDVYQASLAGINRMASQKNPPTLLLFCRGLMHSTHNQPGQAMEDLTQTIEANEAVSLTGMAYIEQAHIFYQQRNWKEALGAVDRGIALIPDGPHGYFRKAQIHSAMENYDAARRELDRARELGLNNRTYWLAQREFPTSD